MGNVEGRLLFAHETAATGIVVRHIGYLIASLPIVPLRKIFC